MICPNLRHGSKLSFILSLPFEFHGRIVVLQEGLLRLGEDRLTLVGSWSRKLLILGEESETTLAALHQIVRGCVKTASHDFERCVLLYVAVVNLRVLVNFRQFFALFYDLLVRNFVVELGGLTLVCIFVLVNSLIDIAVLANFLVTLLLIGCLFSAIQFVCRKSSFRSIAS